MAKNMNRRTWKRLLAAVLCLVTVFSQIVDAALWGGGFSAYAADTSAPIALKPLNGSGEAFIYHSFVDTPEFEIDKTYAFLTGVYNYDDAVSSLGAGAILKVTKLYMNNVCDRYIKDRYDTTADHYVRVVVPGKDFDHCVVGGLYKVPDSGTPTEYRYFCGAGGARNCGPYYAYTYQEESVSFDNVTATLNGIENQGSKKSADYTVTITYDGDKTKVLDPGSYKVSFKAPDTVTFVISDSVGNSITANFQSPLAIRYDGNSDAAANVPSTQEVWKGNSIRISSQTPTRDGYAFVNWKDADSSTTYSSNQSTTPPTSLQLLAQWKDTQAPTVDYTPAQVMTGDTNATVEAVVRAALTITDNEPVSECTVTVTVPTDFTKTPGNKDVTVTVTDKAGNKTTKTCTVYVSSYVDISKPVFTESTKKLTATLNNPGTDPVTASGFVWGVMNSPTLKVNNGMAATSSVVSVAGGTLSVTASNLQKGVTYYARAYITAGDVTYYSEEIEIGLGLPKYGTFRITNSGSNTFTVKRTGGTEGEQKVYYRTVNGSAVGGTNFEHKSGILTIPAGTSSITITIPEYGANKAYTGKPSTAYSNADRTYSVEIYRVTGGAGLNDDAKSATRTMKNDSDSYSVNRDYYTKHRSFAFYKDEVTRGDYDTDGLGWYNGKTGSAASRTVTVNVPGLNADYWKNTATGLAYFMQVWIKEVADGYQHIQITPGSSINTSFYPYSGSYKGFSDFNKMDPAAYAVTLTHGGNGKYDTYDVYTFPSNVPKLANTRDAFEDEYIKSGYGDNTALVFPVTQAQISIGYSASGSASDKWVEKEENHLIWLQDTQEPQLVAVAPMAGGTYKLGDKFVVSLIFDEIVDSQNSTNIKNVKVNTTWGTASYIGGADTNVLYFEGEIAGNASKTLTVNSITGTSYIKDMCDQTGTATKSGSGTTTATVDTNMPNFSVTANGITNGTGKATIKVNANVAYTNSMRYAWSDSSTAPTSGWVTLSASELSTAKSTAGLPLSIRKEAGSGASNGKWYLHVMGFYDTTGASDYKIAMLDFGTKSSPASGSTPPALTASANNASWATSRTITISATGAETLKYRKSDASTWTTLSTTATSVTVTANGYYTFLLTAGDETITKTVSVEKIDREKPTASIGELTSASVESPKAGVYTKLVLPVTYADAGSGVKTVQYSWTNSTATPTSWTTLSTGTGATTVAYTATEAARTTKYLHIKVTDKLNYTYTTYSAAYTVLSQTAVKNHAPTIAITGAPTKWTNDMATLTWQLSGYEGKNYEVILPDGKTSTDASGEVWARQNGSYTVTVRDLDYGGENSATITVDKLDFDAPAVTVSGNSDGWTKTDQTLTITATDSQSGVGEMWYKIVSSDAETPTEGLTALTGSTVTLSDEGKYYVYYKVYDNAGDSSEGIEREANKAEGFVLVQIDKTAPEITFGDYSADTGMTVTVKDGKDGIISSGLASQITYQVKSGSQLVKTGTRTLKEEKTEFSFNLTGLPAGDLVVYVTASDNAGNTYTATYGLHIDIVSVDITWGDLEFTYTDGTWNAGTHAYEGGGWTADSTDGNKITVENKGTTGINVSAAYAGTGAVSGSFTDSEGSAVTGSVTLPVNGTKVIYLALAGKPAAALNKTTLGTVTITLG